MDYVWYEIVYNCVGDFSPMERVFNANVIDGTGVISVTKVAIRNCEPILT